MFKELLKASFITKCKYKSNLLFLQTWLIDMLVIDVQSILYLMGEKMFCTMIKIYYVNSDISLICLFQKLPHLLSFKHFLELQD